MLIRFLAILLSYVAPPPTLESSIRYWQKEMRLQDWRIHLQIVSADRLDDGELGDIEPNRDARTAVMRVIRWQDSDLPRHLAMAEQHVTVVHEMVHLRKFVTGDGNWHSEFETDVEAGFWIRQHRRWRESMAIEK